MLIYIDFHYVRIMSCGCNSGEHEFFFSVVVVVDEVKPGQAIANEIGCLRSCDVPRLEEDRVEAANYAVVDYSHVDRGAQEAIMFLLVSRPCVSYLSGLMIVG